MAKTYYDYKDELEYMANGGLASIPHMASGYRTHKAKRNYVKPKPSSGLGWRGHHLKDQYSGLKSGKLSYNMKGASGSPYGGLLYSQLQKPAAGTSHLGFQAAQKYSNQAAQKNYPSHLKSKTRRPTGFTSRGDQGGFGSKQEAQKYLKTLRQKDVGERSRVRGLLQNWSKNAVDFGEKAPVSSAQQYQDDRYNQYLKEKAAYDQQMAQRRGPPAPGQGRDNVSRTMNMTSDALGINQPSGQKGPTSAQRLAADRGGVGGPAQAGGYGAGMGGPGTGGLGGGFGAGPNVSVGGQGSQFEAIVDPLSSVGSSFADGGEVDLGDGGSLDYNPVNNAPRWNDIYGGLEMPERGEAVAYAQGGLAHPAGKVDFMSEGGMQNRYVQGEGDGTSDDVPAMLAKGEFVIPADIVASLGNGDNEAGADHLDNFMKVVREHKTSNGEEGLPPDSKGALEYIKIAQRKI